MFGFNKNSKNDNIKNNYVNNNDEETIDYELTDEEMSKISSLGVSDFAKYLTDEETAQITKTAKNSTEAFRMMQAIVSDRKIHGDFDVEHSKGRTR